MDGLKRCTTSKLEDLFMNSTLTNDRKIVKVVIFYFLKFVLLRKDPKIKAQPKHVRHIDNIEDFNSYSLYRICFMKTLESLKKDLIDHLRIHKKKRL